MTSNSSSRRIVARARAWERGLVWLGVPAFVGMLTFVSIPSPVFFVCFGLSCILLPTLALLDRAIVKRGSVSSWKDGRFHWRPVDIDTGNESGGAARSDSVNVSDSQMRGEGGP